MILSAEALDILAFLKTVPGQAVSLLQIARQAGGLRRFQESPGWARNSITLLVDAGLVEANSRGHYRFVDKTQPHPPSRTSTSPDGPAPGKSPKASGDAQPPIVGIVGGDYFPTST